MKFKIQTKQNFKQNKIHMQLYFKSKTVYKKNYHFSAKTGEWKGNVFTPSQEI